MKIGWILVALIWIIPIGSMLACPSDLHGFSTCSSVAQFGRNVSFYLVAPGLWLGSSISDALSSDPYSGASFPAFVFGIACWLILLSVMTLYLAKALSRWAGR
ncbi:MAG: hypothetical protein M3Q51_00500 [Pseudomonadota bacterium]|nr:hypothetical protein [Pseudomonadota bacterium]